MIHVIPGENSPPPARPLGFASQAGCGFKMDEEIRRSRPHAVRKYQRLACHPSFGVTFGYQTLPRTTRGLVVIVVLALMSRHAFQHTAGASAWLLPRCHPSRATPRPRGRLEIRFLSLIGFPESCDEDKPILRARPEDEGDLSRFPSSEFLAGSV